jgi:tripartite-type tricarboxylate transporter receptor subunit TctC
LSKSRQGLVFPVSGPLGDKESSASDEVPMKVIVLVVWTLCGVLATLTTGAAEDFPRRPVKIVVPYPAGGTIDAVARLVGHKLQESFQQPVVIENRPGASGNIGADVVAKSPPDGYTILLATNGQASTPAVFRKLPYDAENDLVPVTQLNSSTLVLIANPKLPAKTVPELISYARSVPGSLNYGSTGVGNPLHLTMEMLKMRAGIDMVMVPFRGDAPLLTALLANDIQLAVSPVPTAQAHIQSGALRALALTRATRTSALPHVPTIAEQGFTDFDTSSWHGFFVPARTPEEIVMRIYSETKKALETPDVRERLLSLGAEPVATSPKEFAALFRADLAMFAKVVKDAKIPLQD